MSPDLQENADQSSRLGEILNSLDMRGYEKKIHVRPSVKELARQGAGERVWSHGAG
jgi:hypothetical protein